MMIAGEPSGDLQASLLLQQLRDRRPSWSFFGIGGEGMARQGFEKLIGIKDLGVIGFAGVVGKLLYFRRVYNQMLRLLEERRPDAVILIDYPGFNLRFACRAKARGFRVLYYVAPQVWAWGEKRNEKLRRCTDMLIALFPFENEYFRNKGINVRRVGHPLVDIVKPAAAADDFRSHIGVDSARPLVVLMPGSRPAEVERHLPIMMQAVSLLSAQITEIFPIIVRAPEISEKRIRAIATRDGSRQLHITDDAYSAVAAAAVALTKSGTATVECALLGTPFVVMYKTGWINYHIARRLIKTEHIAMVNLVAGKTIVPEYIQHAATPENLAQTAGGLLTNDAVRTAMIEELARVREKLGPSGGAAQAADIVIDWLENDTAS